jgi:hypothetical protein
MVEVERRWPQRKIRTGIAFVPRGTAFLQPQGARPAAIDKPKRDISSLKQ